MKERSNNLVKDALRLRLLDSLLRNEGVTIRELASQWGIDRRSVCRYLAAIRILVGPTQSDHPRYVHRYVGQPAPFFGATK